MSTNDYLDPIIAIRRIGSEEDPYIDIAESFKICNARVLLSEIPNKFTKVLVSGGGMTDWYEIFSGIPSTNEYRVDYLMGVVYFNPGNEDKIVSFNYKGTGALYFPSSRVWTKEGNNIDTIETLQNLLEPYQGDVLPAASKKYRGRIFTLVSEGVADIPYICLLNEIGEYGWREVLLA